MSWLSRSNNRFNRELSQSRPGPDCQYCLKSPTFGEDPAVMNQILAHLDENLGSENDQSRKVCWGQSVSAMIGSIPSVE